MSLRVHYEILNQKGTPAFFSDTYANRPAFGFAGRVFISTDTGQIFEDTGSAWTLIADAGVGGGTLASVTANGNTTASGIIVTANGISGNVISINGNGTTTGDALLFGQFSASNTTYADRTSIWALNRNVLGIGFSQAAGSPKVINFNSDLLSQGTTETYYLPNSNGALALSQNSITGYNTYPNSSFANSQFYSGVTSPIESHVFNIGVTGTGQATSADTNRWGVGVYGAGYTNGATRSAGVQGDGEVTASGDTGSAIGVRGYATATHSGGLNIGILGDATGSSTGNYGVYTNMTAAANTFANYHLGTAVNYFNGNVLIGLTTSSSKLHVLASDGLIGTFATSSATGGYIGLKYNTSSNFGYIGSGNFLVTGAAVTDLAITTDSGNIVFATGAGNERTRITSGGNVLIGTTTDNGYKLQVEGEMSTLGSIYIKQNNVLNLGYNQGGGAILYYNANGNLYITPRTGFGTTFSAGVVTISNLAGTGSRAVLADASGNLSAPVSDISVKENIQIIGYGLNEIIKMKPVWFDYIDEYKNYGSGRQNGNIAQEMELIIPEAVFITPNTGKKGIDYDQLHAVYIKAIQELNEKLERNNIN
jgi:hypothetical protein